MFKKIFSVILILSWLIISTPTVLANTWSPPAQGCVPPNCNTAEPLDVSSRAQIKAGNLTLQGNFIVDDTDYNLYIDSTNNRLGIGTNALISGIKLEVRDNSSNPATVRITDTGQNPELQWQYNTGANDHWSIYVDKSDSNKLKVWGVGSSGDNRLTVTTDGKLGVGTANPSQKLHVYDTGNVRVRVESVSQTLAAELELMAKNSAGTTKEWHLYTMGNVTPANSLIFWSSDSSNVMAITQAGALGVGTINPSYKIDVQGGQINASGGLCIAGECKTAWSQVGGYPSNIKETTNLAGIHNADFSIYGGASNNGWQGIKNFALANGCDSTWHVCQGWELSYIYSQDYSTAGCNNIFSGLSGDGSDACLGWVIGQFTESIIEVEGDFVEAGDCYGYKSSAVDKYHAAVWYVDQWGTAECSDALPVLCCQ